MTMSKPRRMHNRVDTAHCVAENMAWRGQVTSLDGSRRTWDIPGVTQGDNDLMTAGSKSSGNGATDEPGRPTHEHNLAGQGFISCDDRN